jgi:hypothetical protein
MKTYTAIIENNSAIVKCTENDEVIYAVRYDYHSAEELEIIDSMTSEDLRNYVNRNEGVVVKVEEEVEESEGDTLPTVYTVNDTESGNYTIYCGTSLEDAKEAILDDEDPEMWDLYIGENRVWCGKINDVDELNGIK